jgi:YHS domain-containing protein
MRLQFILIPFVFAMLSCAAQDSGVLNTKGGVGIGGYDPVSYFTKAGPEKGSRKIKANYQGVNYLFVREENKQQFLLNPEKYLPQYGGWCAYAMGLDGSKVDVDPLTYKIVDGKLYLFYNKLFTNTLLDWNKNEAVLKKTADDNWEQLLVEE